MSKDTLMIIIQVLTGLCFIGTIYFNIKTIRLSKKTIEKRKETMKLLEQMGDYEERHYLQHL